jgi:putative ubiquitin-RnfH superfamily antitoxin RatB of RatAB toxin-antitoxin module
VVADLVTTPASASASASAPGLDIEVAWSAAPRQTGLIALSLPAGSTVADAVAASAPRWLADGLSPDDWVAAVQGRRVAADALLRGGERVELCRGLRVDPKQARRLRYQAQGGRAARLTRGGRGKALPAPDPQGQDDAS